jgi:hypothetical protein
MVTRAAPRFLLQGLAFASQPLGGRVRMPLVEALDRSCDVVRRITGLRLTERHVRAHSTQ